MFDKSYCVLEISGYIPSLINPHYFNSCNKFDLLTCAPDNT